jgi:hypothetical protein
MESGFLFLERSAGRALDEEATLGLRGDQA